VIGVLDVVNRSDLASVLRAFAESPERYPESVVRSMVMLSVVPYTRLSFERTRMVCGCVLIWISCLHTHDVVHVHIRQYYRDERVVVIYDKYPKGLVHLLVLPRPVW